MPEAVFVAGFVVGIVVAYLACLPLSADGRRVEPDPDEAWWDC